MGSHNPGVAAVGEPRPDAQPGQLSDERRIETNSRAAPTTTSAIGHSRSVSSPGTYSSMRNQTPSRTRSRPKTIEAPAPLPRRLGSAPAYPPAAVVALQVEAVWVSASPGAAASVP